MFEFRGIVFGARGVPIPLRGDPLRPQLSLHSDHGHRMFFEWGHGIFIRVFNPDGTPLHTAMAVHESVADHFLDLIGAVICGDAVWTSRDGVPSVSARSADGAFCLLLRKVDDRKVHYFNMETVDLVIETSANIPWGLLEELKDVRFSDSAS